MAFSALINRHVFTTRVFDSGALTVLASVIHPFTEPGRYHVAIRRGDVLVGATRFEVSAEAAATQLNIDLAVAGSSGAPSAFMRGAGGGRGARAASGAGGAARAAASASASDCGCGGGGAGGAGSSGGGGVAGVQARGLAGPIAGAAAVASGSGLPSVSPKGYVQFFVSHGEGGFSARVSKEGSDTVLFDTTLLGAGDLFAVSLLAPATFSLVNKAGTATGTVTVTFSKDVAARVKTTTPVYVETSKSAFTPKDLAIASGQGLVFRVTDAARIVVTQQSEPASAAPQARGHAAARRFYRVPQVKPRNG